MSERDELAKAVFVADNYNATDDVTLSDWEALVASDGDGSYAHRIAQGLIQAGYRKPRTIETVEDANELPDRSAIITPGQIIFRKWEDYYAEGKHAWERGVDQTLPAELLDEAAHLPAIVLWEPK